MIKVIYIREDGSTIESRDIHDSQPIVLLDGETLLEHGMHPQLDPRYVTAYTIERGSNVKYPPSMKQRNPIRAYKQARLILKGSSYNDCVSYPPRLGLAGVGNGSSLIYDPDSYALCLASYHTSIVWDDHDPPELFCTCGFYSLPDLTTLRVEGYVDSSMVVLEVEIFGKVIRHNKGYRASRQRVLGIELPYVNCSSCGKQLREMIPVDAPSYANGKMLAPFCEYCKLAKDRPIHLPTLASYSSFTASDISNLLGVETRWRSEHKFTPISWP